MTDGRETGGPGFDERLAAALRRAEAEARPRPEFRDDLRVRFVAGDLASPAPRVLALPRWILYPAAAGILALAFALSGALEGSDPADPPIPMPEAVRAPEAALAAAEKRVRAHPVLASVSSTLRHRVVDGRPWLLPDAASFADGTELRALGSYMAASEGDLFRNLPGIAARPARPVVTLVAPTRRAFEDLVAPLMAPVEVGAVTVAFAFRDPGVLLLSPEALDPGGPPCGSEEMNVLHEAAHAWLHARGAPGSSLPLWVDEGLAAAAAAGKEDVREWCRKLIAYGRKEGLDPFSPRDVLAMTDFQTMAAFVKARAPRPEEPYTLMVLFYGHAEGLTLFLTDGEEPARRDRFLLWLGDRLDGKPTDPEATARDLGFADVEALFAARDAWLGL